jgi:transposase
VHCKSLPAQEVRALLTTRKLLQAKRHDVEMSLRGVLRGFGLKVGPTTPKTFAGRVRDLVAVARPGLLKRLHVTACEGGWHGLAGAGSGPAV